MKEFSGKNNLEHMIKSTRTGYLYEPMLKNNGEPVMISSSELEQGQKDSQVIYCFSDELCNYFDEMSVQFLATHTLGRDSTVEESSSDESDMEIDNNEIENVEREIQLESLETERHPKRRNRGLNGELVR